MLNEFIGNHIMAADSKSARCRSSWPWLSSRMFGKHRALSGGVGVVGDRLTETSKSGGSRYTARRDREEWAMQANDQKAS